MCAAVVQGISAIYGVADAIVTNAIVQSYTNDGEFSNEATIVDETGKTITWRGDDRKTSISCELISKTSSMPVLGAAFSLIINTSAAYPAGSPSTTFSGWITKVSCKGSNKSFSSFTVSAVGYEAITPA
jgi:hypothetical protein